MARFAGRLPPECNLVLHLEGGLRAAFFVVAMLSSIFKHCLSAKTFPNIYSQGVTQQLEQVELGGVKQWLLLRGNVQRPILLVLHGGPGSAEIATASRYQRGLEPHFLVVNWDQRGAGKSHGHGVLSVKQLAADTTELIELLLARFGQQKLYLLGHSWGSALGLLITRRSPELVYGVIGVGQLVDGAANERLSFEYVREYARRTGNQLALTQLRRHPPPYGDDVRALLTQRTWLYLSRGFFYSRVAALRYALAFLTSTTYSFSDKLSYSHHLRASLRQLWSEVEALDLFRDVPSVATPVLFCLGKHDMTTPSVLAARYFEALVAPSKQLVWFDASAHCPNLEEPQKFAATVLDWAKQTKTYAL